MAVSPTVLFFGSVRVGQTACKPITVENAGTADLTVAIAGSPADSPFSWEGFAGTLPPKGERELRVCFTPRAHGEAVTTLSVASTAPSSPNRIAVAGAGIVAAR